jgi:hypothetical protein
VTATVISTRALKKRIWVVPFVFTIYSVSAHLQGISHFPSRELIPDELIHFNCHYDNNRDSFVPLRKVNLAQDATHNILCCRWLAGQYQSVFGGGAERESLSAACRLACTRVK